MGRDVVSSRSFQFENGVFEIGVLKDDGSVLKGILFRDLAPTMKQKEKF